MNTQGLAAPDIHANLQQMQDHQAQPHRDGKVGDPLRDLQIGVDIWRGKTLRIHSSEASQALDEID